MRGPQSALLTGTIATLYLAGNAGLLPLSQPSNSDIQAHRASHIIGLTVEDPNGVVVGTAKDLVVDMSSGQTKYAIVSSGGVFGIGARVRAVPAQALSTATAKRDTLALSISQAQWEEAPPFNGTLASLSQKEQAGQLHKYYDKLLPKSGVTPPNPPPGAPAGLSPTGRSGREPETQPGLKFASTLMGKDIANRQRENLGQITDLLVDLANQRPVLAIVSANNRALDNQRFAVPIRLLSLTTRNKLLLHAPLKVFEQAPTLDAQAWQTHGSDIVYRYPEGEADNTRRNTRDRGEGALTPFDQSGAAGDWRLTRQIRVAVVQDDQLSLTAKNIKIITVNGKVTLRGPVLHEQERAQIEHWARQIAGPHNLVNQLEVKNN